LPQTHSGQSQELAALDPVNYDEVFIVNDKGFPVVPEPATLPLTATGLLGLAALVRDRRSPIRR
jgi:hypothetical protein